MRVKTRLFASATLAMGLVAVPALAAAAPKDLAAQQAEEIRLLKEQVQALTARLDSQEAAARAATAPGAVTAKAPPAVAPAPTVVAAGSAARSVVIDRMEHRNSDRCSERPFIGKTPSGDGGGAYIKP
jgi:hypothetical protein